MVTREDPQAAGAEQRLKEFGIRLPSPPQPFGISVEAVQAGSLLFLSGMLPTEGREAKFIGRVGAELDAEAGYKAARLAALNALAVAGQHLGSLGKIKRVVRLGVSVATSGDVRDQPKVADGASELLQDVFGRHKNPCRLVVGVASLPLGTPVELELIFEVVDEGRAGRRVEWLAQVPGKGTPRATSDILSHDAGRRTLHLLSGGRPEGRTDAAAAARTSLVVADVRAAVRPVVRSLSPCRA